MVPKISAALRPNLFATMLPVRQANVIVAKRIALPALMVDSQLVTPPISPRIVWYRRACYITRYGVCWPPAPTDCIAFHSPGAAKAASPTIVALKKTPRRQLYAVSLAPRAPLSRDADSWTRVSRFLFSDILRLSVCSRPCRTLKSCTGSGIISNPQLVHHKEIKDTDSAQK